MARMDADKRNTISHKEFTDTFTKWFDKFSDPKSGTIAGEEIRTLGKEGISGRCRRKGRETDADKKEKQFPELDI